MRVLAIAIFLIGATLVACSSGDTDSGDEPLEYKLAVIHHGGYVAPDDPLVAQFRSLLVDLDAYCPDTQQQISDYSVTATNLLNESGLDDSLLETMQNMNTFFAAGGDATIKSGVDDSCDGAFALWVTGRKGQ